MAAFPLTKRSRRSSFSQNRKCKFMNEKFQAIETKEKQYEVGGLTSYRNRVASGGAAYASAIAAAPNDVDVLSGGDFGATYVDGDPAG
ncbi:hypothetical protein LXL04_026460 [Taraxacum kok-saghyz]